MNVFVVERDSLISQMFANEKGFTITSKLKDAGIVVFPGGPDVSPSLYNHPKHPSTYTDPRRDMAFDMFYKMVQRPEVVKVGICGGGQFLHVKNGGVMLQDVDKHTYSHEMIYNSACIDTDKPTGTTYEVTSTHHQMMRQNGWSELWGIAAQSTRRELYDDKDKYVDPDKFDTEILYYPDTRCLCFQPHPEYRSDSTRKVFFKALHTVLSKRKVK